MAETTATSHAFPRQWMALAASVLFAFVLTMALHVHHGDAPLRVDDAAARVVNSPRLSQALSATNLFQAGSKSLFREAVNLGSPFLVLGVAVALAAVAHHRRDRLAVVVCLAGPLVAAVLTELVGKPLVDRRMDTALTFPSGHATDAGVLATLVLVLVFRWQGFRLVPRWAPVAAAVPLLVSMAVVGLGWHYPTDAVGGVAVGVASVLGVAAALPEPGTPTTTAGPPAREAG